jgi:hypothetical protein
MLLHFSGEKALRTAGMALCRTVRLALLPMLIFRMTLPGTLSSVVLAVKVCSNNFHYPHLFSDDSYHENSFQNISAIHMLVL